MRLRSLFATLALVTAAIVGSGSSAPAAFVLTDSGNIGQFMATNTGVSAGGTATIVFAIPNVSAQLNTVNGQFITPENVALNGPVTLLVTPVGTENYNLQLVPATYQKTIGNTVGQQAILNFNLTTGVAPSILPDFFNMSGLVTSLAANANPNHDFGAFANGLGNINITLTATQFTGASDFKSFIANAGAVAVGNGSFSQAAVPEPASMAMVGLGLVGTVAGGYVRKHARKA